MTRGYAMIANGGKLVEPHLVKSVEEPRSRGRAAGRPSAVHAEAARATSASIPTALQVVQEGALRRHPRELRHLAAASSEPSRCRSRARPGTAEKFVKLPGYAGLRDQSWWCGYGPYEAPEIAVCALIENGGHGGTAAAPAALKVFEKYFNVEPAATPP